MNNRPLIEKPSRPDYPKTTILRNNPGMFRDCWAEKDNHGDWIFAVRQIKFDNEGAQPELKIIRLSLDEAKELAIMISHVITPEGNR